jgi:hypothetical protein
MDIQLLTENLFNDFEGLIHAIQEKKEITDDDLIMIAEIRVLIARSRIFFNKGCDK